MLNSNSENFNQYLNVLDFSSLRKYFIENGTLRNGEKKDYFVKQGTSAHEIALIESGGVRYTCVGNDGKEQIVGYSFQHDFACCYVSFIHKKPSILNAQYIQKTSLYVLSYNQIMNYLEQDINTQRFRRMIAEEFATQTYERLLSFYCDTPEERYISLMKRHNKLLNYISLKEIASYIGVTPETLSHIRKKLSMNEKS